MFNTGKKILWNVAAKPLLAGAARTGVATAVSQKHLVWGATVAAAPFALGYVTGAYAGTWISSKLWGDKGAKTALDLYMDPFDSDYIDTVSTGLTWSNIKKKHFTPEIPLGYLYRETLKTAQGLPSELYGTK